ncbi:MAG: 3'-5' exonuclease, partial [Bacteroidia bacterium]|nr:hypothetical protein [Bacteroidia bacterium]MDW8134868.1 3'-5' exonuclease [Bacteroidia bacterium]
LIMQHPLYGRVELIRWWEHKGRHIELQLAATEGVHPILTIHKAKGLAWRVVIVPFAEWDLFSIRWRNPEWRRVSEKLIPPSLQALLRERAISRGTGETYYELPLKITASVKDESLQEVYQAYYIEHVVENVNLHYVATTRPREYLFLIAKPPSARFQMGANTWAGFWSDEELTKDFSSFFSGSLANEGIR